MISKPQKKKIIKWIIIFSVAYVITFSYFFISWALSPKNSKESYFWFLIWINQLLIPFLVLIPIIHIKQDEIFISEVKEKFKKHDIPEYVIQNWEKIKAKKNFSSIGVIFIYSSLIGLICFINLLIYVDLKIFEKNILFDNVFSIILIILLISGSILFFLSGRTIKKDEQWYNQAAENFILGSFSETIFLLERVIEINPHSIQAWYLLSRAYYKLKDFDIALEVCNQCLNIDPKFDKAIELKEKIFNSKF